MTIRLRLSLWYASILFLTLMIMGALLYWQLVLEPRQEAHRHHHHHDEDLMDSDASEDITDILLFCGLPAALLAVAGGWWLMKKSLAPVASLTRATEKITAQNLGSRLPRTHNGDELDQLTEVFNSMLARLDDSFNRIREFTLHASHELKTPLTVMRGEVETALRTNTLPPAERERAVSQLEELQRITHIVDSLTLLAKADAGQLTLTRAAVALDDLVQDSFADLQILADGPGLQVELAVCEKISIQGDRHRLRQLLLNLADNAVKYNQPQGRITLSLRQVENLAEFQISNTGPGIPAEQLPRVFDRFFRGDPAHGNAVEGCGLGLSIVQWIVQAHGGKIQITSEPTRLTTVTVQLPLS